jgi:hypothetical protein
MYWSTILIKPSVIEGRPVIYLPLTKRFFACSYAHGQPIGNDFFPSPRSCAGASVSLHLCLRRHESNNTVVLDDRSAIALPLRASSRRRFAIDCSHAAVRIGGLCLRRCSRSRVSAAYTVRSWLPVHLHQLGVSFKPPLRKLTIRVVLPLRGFIDAIVRC